MTPETPLKARAVAASRIGVTLAEYDRRIARLRPTPEEPS